MALANRPATMNRLLDDLRSRIDDAEIEAKESHKVSMNSYGAGYDRGFAEALKELWQFITGDEYKPQTEK